MNAEAEKIITQLGLAPLPVEGGFFRQTWISRERLANGRAAGSAVYFLITPEDFSALHRLKTDELWHFYAGDPVEHLQLDPRDGSACLTAIGSDVAAGQHPQLTVPGGVWQGGRLALSPAEGLAEDSAGRAALRPRPGQPSKVRGWALLGCTLAPAWDEREFSVGQRTELLRDFPHEARLIVALTR